MALRNAEKHKVRHLRKQSSDVAALREIPAVGRVLQRPSFRTLGRRIGAGLLTDLVRERLEDVRAAVHSGKLSRSAAAAATRPEALRAGVEQAAARILAPSPRTVVNATGVIVHTNLGRSILSPSAAARVAEAAASYTSLEYDLEKGKRGSRMVHLAPLLARLFPGRAFVAVNNNAAAILLVLRALASRREVIVSRGELVEIGGSFRIPEILELSGAVLREVGTTNRTRAADYGKALSRKTGALLKVHTSNFRIVGFTEDAGVRALSAIARGAGVPLVVDAGSGDLVDLHPLGIRDETPVRTILEDGADVVTFSADKLLGGPQAGIIVAREDWVERIRSDPFARVCRLDRLQIAALRETLAAHVRGAAFEEVPTLRMLALSKEDVGERADRLRREIAKRARRGGIEARLRIIDGGSRTGGGSSPAGERPTRLLAISPTESAARFERALRAGEPPVLARVHEGEVLLDLRTVLPAQDARLAACVARALADGRPR